MSIKTRSDNWAVYGTGHLQPAPWQQHGLPEMKTGAFRCEAGIATVSIDYCRQRKGSVEQVLTAETVIDGRTRRLLQTRTGNDWLTEAGAKRVVLRWLRELQD